MKGEEPPTMSPTRTLLPRYDVVVVGARCAGAATAMLLARAGLRVLAVDRGAPGSDTLSTHALMRGGVVQLRRWGLLRGVEVAGTPPVRRAVFHYGDEIIDVAIKAHDGVEAFYAPRRTVLDALLAAAASEAGAEVVHGVRLAGLDGIAEGRVRGVVVEDTDGGVKRIEAGLVIGADGLRSTVARLVEAAPYRVGHHATGIVYGYWSGLDIVDAYHWYYRPGVSAGAIPTNGGETCVFAAAPASRFRDEVRHDVAGFYHRVLAESAPDLATDVSRARRMSPLRGFPGEPGFLRRSWGAGWALVGDAGYFRDPLTAHGITDALRDAELLARSVLRGTDEALAEYEAERDGLAEGLFAASDEMASFAWDLQSVKQTHLFMTREMGREAAALVALDREPHGSGPRGERRQAGECRAN
jgi:flavin-dependent dehydrogenase